VSGRINYAQNLVPLDDEERVCGQVISISCIFFSCQVDGRSYTLEVGSHCWSVRASFEIIFGKIRVLWP
jgi:hypothetical protein